MKKYNYTLPIPKELKAIRCPNKFKTIQSALDSLKEYSHNEAQLILNTLFPSIDYYSSSIDIIKTCPVVKRSMKYIKDIDTGYIRKVPFYFIHPSKRKDKEESRKNWIAKYSNFVVDAHIAVFDQSFLTLTKREALKEVAHNALLKSIIEELNKFTFGVFETDFTEINALQYEIKEKEIEYLKSSPPRSIPSVRWTYNEISPIENEMAWTIFKSKLTLKENAARLLDKANRSKLPCPVLLGKSHCNCKDDSDDCIFYTCPITRPLSKESKEIIIRQYLYLKSSKVNKSKRSNGKGINAGKRLKIRNYKRKYPAATIAEIMRELKVSRNLVSKVIK